MNWIQSSTWNKYWEWDADESVFKKCSNKFSILLFANKKRITTEKINLKEAFMIFLKLFDFYILHLVQKCFARILSKVSKDLASSVNNFLRTHNKTVVTLWIYFMRLIGNKIQLFGCFDRFDEILEKEFGFELKFHFENLNVS